MALAVEHCRKEIADKDDDDVGTIRVNSRNPPYNKLRRENEKKGTN